MKRCIAIACVALGIALPLRAASPEDAVTRWNVGGEAVLVGEVESRDAARALAQKEGIFCGISSGATFAAAVKVAAKAPPGAVLLAMLPDTGERYLTTWHVALSALPTSRARGWRPRCSCPTCKRP